MCLAFGSVCIKDHLKIHLLLFYITFVFTTTIIFVCWETVCWVRSTQKCPFLVTPNNLDTRYLWMPGYDIVSLMLTSTCVTKIKL